MFKDSDREDLEFVATENAKDTASAREAYCKYINPLEYKLNFPYTLQKRTTKAVVEAPRSCEPSS